MTGARVVGLDSRAVGAGKTYHDHAPEVGRVSTERVAALLDQHPGARVILVAKHLCAGGTCAAVRATADLWPRLHGAILAPCCHRLLEEETY